YCGAVRADRVDPHRLLGRKDADEPVEIGLPRAIIVLIAYPLDRLAYVVTRELEWAGAHDVLLVPVRILIENLFLVDPGVGIGERRQKCVGRELQPEHHGRRIGRLDLVDHDEIALSRARYAIGGTDDRLPARRNVRGSERRAVVKLHALADLKGIGLSAV